MEGDTAVVTNVWQDNLGAAYVYEYSGGSWTEKAKLLDPTESRMEIFGAAADLDGNRLAVGARLDATCRFEGLLICSTTGSVNLFQRTDSGWIWIAEFVPCDQATETAFGASLDLQGSRLLVGAYWTDEGSAYLFEETPHGWEFLWKFVPIDAQDDDRTGQHVALVGDTALVSSPLRDDAATDAGSMFIFPTDIEPPGPELPAETCLDRVELP